MLLFHLFVSGHTWGTGQLAFRGYALQAATRVHVVLRVFALPRHQKVVTELFMEQGQIVVQWIVHQANQTGRVARLLHHHAPLLRSKGVAGFTLVTLYHATWLVVVNTLFVARRELGAPVRREAGIHLLLGVVTQVILFVQLVTILLVVITIVAAAMTIRRLGWFVVELWNNWEAR